MGSYHMRHPPTLTRGTGWNHVNGYTSSTASAVKQAVMCSDLLCAKRGLILAMRISIAAKPRFVVGSIGPGTKLISLGQTTWEAMLDSYTEQCRGLIDGGADAFIIETCQDLLQVKCAINACLDALAEKGKSHEDVPILVSITIETSGTMLLGTEIAAAVNALRMFPIACLGLNCATGPVEMAEHIGYISKHWDRYVSVIPNAGLPVLVEGRTEFPLKARPFVESLTRYVREYGVNIVGGCCGTTPEHIRHIKAAVENPAKVRLKSDTAAPTARPGATSRSIGFSRTLTTTPSISAPPVPTFDSWRRVRLDAGCRYGLESE